MPVRTSTVCLQPCSCTPVHMNCILLQPGSCLAALPWRSAPPSPSHGVSRCAHFDEACSLLAMHVFRFIAVAFLACTPADWLSCMGFRALSVPPDTSGALGAGTAGTLSLSAS